MWSGRTAHHVLRDQVRPPPSSSCFPAGASWFLSRRDDATLLGFLIQFLIQFLISIRFLISLLLENENGRVAAGCRGQPPGVVAAARARRGRGRDYGSAEAASLEWPQFRPWRGRGGCSCIVLLGGGGRAFYRSKFAGARFGGDAGRGRGGCGGIGFTRPRSGTSCRFNCGGAAPARRRQAAIQEGDSSIARRDPLFPGAGGRPPAPSDAR